MKNVPHLSKEARFYDIVKKGVRLLAEQQEYKQSNLINKLKTLDLAISSASLSNIVNDKPAGLKVLKTAANGLQTIIERELGMAYSKEHREFRANGLSDWEPYIIPEEPLKLPDDSGLVIHEDGRVSIGYKTEFIATAQKEVIEVGVRLKTFSEYFTSRRENEYKDYISTLLKKGVSFKAYLLDPDSNEARLYFDDRARVQESESDAIAEMKKAIEKLIRIAKEFEQNRYPGSFEIYIYKHIPYNHFLVVDRQLEGGKMMVSHYLYATRRAECPVWEFRRSTHPKLYEMYHRSLVSFVQHAKRLP